MINTPQTDYGFGLFYGISNEHELNDGVYTINLPAVVDSDLYVIVETYFDLVVPKTCTDDNNPYKIVSLLRGETAIEGAETEDFDYGPVPILIKADQ